MADPRKLPFWMRLEISMDWFNVWHAVRLVYEFTRDGHGLLWSLDIAWLVFWDCGCWEPLGNETWREKWCEYVYYQKHGQWPATPADAGKEKP